jgi:Family of unknown function (DUF6455)
MPERGGDAMMGDTAELESGLVARLRNWWEGLRERRRLGAEFGALEQQGQLDTVLQEAGVTRGAVDAILHAHPGAPKRLAAMLRRLGISRERLRESGTAHDVEMTCTLCGATGQCEHWLRSGKTAGYDAFCPNKEAFDALRAKKS